MMEIGERSNSAIPSIVRLKALRPQEYIEKHAVMNVSVSAELPSHDAAQLLREMLANLTESTRALLANGPTVIDVPPALPEADSR